MYPVSNKDTGQIQMARRVSLLLRGPGILALVLIVLLLVTVESRHGKSRAASATPTIRPTATPTIPPTVAPTVTPTPAPRITFRISVRSARRFEDRKTKMQVRVVRAVVGTVGAPSKPSHLALVLQLTLSNRSGRLRRFSFRDFYVVSPSGQTYGAQRRSRRSGESGLMGRGRTRTIEADFLLPPGLKHVSVIWNDNSRLFPPVSIAHVQIVRRVS
jgi:hypothetical protein